MNLIDADKLGYEDVECVDGNTYMVVHEPEIRFAPSPFKGMTNGDVMKAMLDLKDEQIDFGSDSVYLYPTFIGGMTFAIASREWWNAPYKGASE